MLDRLRRAIGWVSKAERQGAQIDFDNALMFRAIRDKPCLLSALIALVPDGSVWSIEGGITRKAYHVLALFEADDDVTTMKATIWPRQPTLTVRLDGESKPVVQRFLRTWGRESLFIHQHIHYRGHFYLTAFDHMYDACTWVSTAVGKDFLDKLVADGCVQIDPSP